MIVALHCAAAQSEARYNAKTNYILHCQGCHGADGVGALPESVAPLANSIGYFLRIPEGRRYLVQVPGAAYSAVDDAALAELLNYTLERFSAAQLPAGFRRYTAEDVARVRRSPENIVALRARLVAELREDHGVCAWVADDPLWGSECGEKSYGSVD
jgi:hypothetical protein